MIQTPCAVIPAAGRSSRMGTRNKLLLPLGGKTLIEHTLAPYLQIQDMAVFVVLGYQRERFERVLAPYPVRLIHNPDHETGLASSLVRGVSAAGENRSGYLFALGDMPLIQPATVRLLLDRFCGSQEPRIVLPTRGGCGGHPVIFSRHYFADLVALSGDRGAKSVIEAHAAEVVSVAVNDKGVLRDVDHERAYRELRTEWS